MSTSDPGPRPADRLPVAGPGERWGYRARGIDPLVEVEVVRHGTQKPARVLIRFVDASFEGREEWVPPARLKVPWSGAVEFEAREAHWERVDTHPGLREQAIEYAVDTVFELVIDSGLAEHAYRRPGVTTIRDVAGLARRLQLDEALLREAPESFEDEGAFIVPWATTERIVRRACELFPDVILRDVEKDEAEARREAMHGRWYRGARSTGDFFVTPEEPASRDDEWAFGRPKRQVLRDWCGSEATNRQDELKALREEVVRLDRLVGDAIRVLRAHKLDTPATSLEREFGIPVEEARKSRG
jgi:hypothetical protein